MRPRWIPWLELPNVRNDAGLAAYAAGFLHFRPRLSFKSAYYPQDYFGNLSFLPRLREKMLYLKEAHFYIMSVW